MPTRDDIESTCKRFLDAFAQGNASSIAATFTEDAILHFPGSQPIRGQDAIEDHYAKFFASGQKAVPAIAYWEISHDDGLAFAVGSYSVPGETGTFVDVYELQDDGLWRTKASIAGPNH